MSFAGKTMTLSKRWVRVLSPIVGSCSSKCSALSVLIMCLPIVSSQHSCMNKWVVHTHEWSKRRWRERERERERERYWATLDPYPHFPLTTWLTFIPWQFCDDVVMGRFPASHERLLKLAALRIQFLEGDYKIGVTMYELLNQHSA